MVAPDDPRMLGVTSCRTFSFSGPFAAWRRPEWTQQAALKSKPSPQLSYFRSRHVAISAANSLKLPGSGTRPTSVMTGRDSASFCFSSRFCITLSYASPEPLTFFAILAATAAILAFSSRSRFGAPIRAASMWQSPRALSAR